MSVETDHKMHLKEAAKWLHGILVGTPIDVMDGEGQTKATGVRLPSGAIVVNWNREYFEPDERTDESVVSIYANESDAEQATGGRIVDE